MIPAAPFTFYGERQKTVTKYQRKQLSYIYIIYNGYATRVVQKNRSCREMSAPLKTLSIIVGIDYKYCLVYTGNYMLDGKF